MRIAFFSPPLPSHLGPAASLAEALRARGHRCFMVAAPDLALPPALERLPLDPAGLGWSAAQFAALTRRPGVPFGIRRVVKAMSRITASLCEQAPSLLRGQGIDAVVCDQMEPGGTLVAEHLGLPWVSLAAAFPNNREPLVPLPVLPWPYEDSPQALGRNRVAARIADWLTAGHDRTVREWSARLGVPRRGAADCLSPLLDLAQGVRGFDFPRQQLPPSFRYVGRLQAPRRDVEAGDLPPFDGRPLVYVTFGTLQGHRLDLFRKVVRACRSLDVQVLVTHGGALTPAEANTIGADWALPWVDQEAVLDRADLVVTHGGYNTVLESLAAGRPILCLPLAFEQPGIAARIAYTGVGLRLSPRAPAPAIAEAVGRLLAEPGFAERARQIGVELAAAGGSERAADLVEQALAAPAKRVGGGAAVTEVDLILVGGGLSNGLLAWHLLQRRPELRLLVLERGRELGGNHTWCFHGGDLSTTQLTLIEPLVAHRWNGYEVRFPGLRRELGGTYHCVTSAHFARVLGPRLGGRVRLNTTVTAMRPDGVTLDRGGEIRGTVVDGTGFRASPHLQIRFQSFLGQELKLARSHGLRAPVLMDATTPQDGGYRFTYLLPFDAQTVLVEDTGYVDHGHLNRRDLEARVRQYCERQGWQPEAVLREESGVLPITLGGDWERFWADADGVPRIGLAGGFFHPTTGYSLPEAVRVAELVAALPDLSPAAVFAAPARARPPTLARAAFRPGAQPHAVPCRAAGGSLAGDGAFYRLPQALIERFYAGRLTLADKVRIVSGKPPVPLMPALGACCNRSSELR